MEWRECSCSWRWISSEFSHRLITEKVLDTSSSKWGRRLLLAHPTLSHDTGPRWLGRSGREGSAGGAQ